ncbi:MAG: xanthine dehydrogenase family protein molybdopterin-binding subunit [Acidimicrobiia bacterium]|nr:MAG: xanthine dehydrogenase family protein molybdopterin-binding subunit [Acidimicrobiia bacterium]
MTIDPHHGIVGKAAPRVDSLAQATGMTRYVDDLSFPGMLHGKILRSTQAHARIVSIDTSAAEALPGVHVVLTGTDLPVPFGLLPVSQDEHALAIDKVRHVGDAVAAVAADDPDIAQRAIDLIEVAYEPLPVVTTITEAVKVTDEPIHREPPRNNRDREMSLEFGDVDAGFEAADHIREDVFFYQGNNHAALETHGAVAVVEEDGRLHVFSATQVPHYLHRILASVLEMPEGRIRVTANPTGGGFGAKTDVFSHELVTAQMARITGRPVKIVLTREEVFYAHRGRHPVLMWVKTGFISDGAITAMSFKTFLDGGAYGSYGAASLLYTGQLQTVTYRIPAYRFQGVRVFTNKPACGPKRGHGTPQPRFALEVHLDKAAEELGLDPITIRKRNLVEPFTSTVNHLRITSCGLSECIDRVVETSGFQDRYRNLPGGRGLGFAVGAYMSGAGLPIYFNDMPQSEVMLKVDRGGGVTVYSMAADCGQGSTTMLATVVGETLGLNPSELVLVTADTDLTPVDLGSYSSRVTFMAGNAALDAALKLADLVLTAVADELNLDPDVVSLGRGVVLAGDREIPWAEAVRIAEAKWGLLVTTGTYKPPKDIKGDYRGAGVGPSPAYSYSACVAEVDCDRETGHVSVERVWLAHDVGRAINPLLVRGQIEGSVHMALGEVLMEEQAFRGALHSGPSLLDYKIPTVLEMPQVESIIVESIDAEGPFGAKEVGQGPLLPVIPAVVNAVHDALGIRIDEIPVRPEKVLAALDDLERGGDGRYGPTDLPNYTFRSPQRVDPPPETVTV